MYKISDVLEAQRYVGFSATLSFDDPMNITDSQLSVQIPAESYQDVMSYINAKPLRELRASRDGLLAQTDWWVMPDRTATQEQLDYRQALRDITNTYTSLDDVVWPTKP